MLSGTFLPALLFQAIAIRPRPVERQPFFLKQLREDDIPVLDDLDFDRHAVRIHDAADIGGAASKTPQHSRARLDGVCRHVASAPFRRADRFQGRSEDLNGTDGFRQARLERTEGTESTGQDQHEGTEAISWLGMHVLADGCAAFREMIATWDPLGGALCSSLPSWAPWRPAG